jgi:acetate---CoA ligase (ADP-forming)
MLVEEMAPRGVELIVGARRDPQWGPVVLVGLGGIWTEALDDVRLMPADLSREGIIAEINQLKGARLLHGLRGAAPVDIGAIADVVVRVGALMCAQPEITEIDINPLVAYPDRVLALDALIVTA